MNGFLDGAMLFGGILAALYAVTVAIYFILGFGITWMNDRNPERRIQKGRFGEKRRQAEIRQSMASILVTCLSVAIGIFAQLQGWTITPWAFSWWTALPLFLLTMVLFDAWFYFAHRALHTKPLYKYHALHHKSVAPTAWSNDSIGLVDTALSQGFYAVVVFIIPIPPVILLAHRAFDQINGTFGHAGFEYFASKTARYPSPMLCTTYHDQHHAEFRFNYANYFSFWDRIMGTISPVYDQRVESFEANQAPLSLKRPIDPAKEKAAS
ncbi:sterol desaturase family protein [Rhizobium sp. RU20A]|uniref:sterol desaturase family protein n=1 Tax=Rhizobium sp. RU20A TaxID=1907412 RepID=UPI001FCF252D|nr:sterol desaturase family protein [Rhizobium sp. RU20A]